MSIKINMPLAIHLSIHALVSILIGFLVSIYFGSVLVMIFSAFLFGFLIDDDHLIDYFLFYNSFNLKKFLRSEQFTKSGRLIKLFHSWELVLILFILAFFNINNLLFQGVLISASFSLFIHLLSDCIINKEPLIFYSLLFRYKNNFDINKIKELEVVKQKV